GALVGADLLARLRAEVHPGAVCEEAVRAALFGAQRAAQDPRRAAVARLVRHGDLVEIELAPGRRRGDLEITHAAAAEQHVGGDAAEHGVVAAELADREALPAGQARQLLIRRADVVDVSLA